MDELVANLSPIDSQVWKWAWLGSIGWSSRLFRFRWHKMNTAIITTLAIPNPRPIIINSLTSVSCRPDGDISIWRARQFILRNFSYIQPHLSYHFCHNCLSRCILSSVAHKIGRNSSENRHILDRPWFPSIWPWNLLPRLPYQLWKI